MADLFRHYDVDSRGVVNASSTVTVEIQFLLMRVQRLVSYVIVTSCQFPYSDDDDDDNGSKWVIK